MRDDTAEEATHILCEVSETLGGKGMEVTALVLTTLAGEWLFYHPPANRDKALAAFIEMTQAVCDGYRASACLERRRG